MAATFKSKVQKDLLTCPVCCSQYNNPRVLDCQHTFCCSCLEGCCTNNNKSNSIKCPLCRKVTSLSKKGIAALPNNIIATGLLHLLNETKPITQTTASGKSGVTRRSVDKPKMPKRYIPIPEKSDRRISNSRGRNRQSDRCNGCVGGPSCCRNATKSNSRSAKGCGERPSCNGRSSKCCRDRSKQASARSKCCQSRKSKQVYGSSDSSISEFTVTDDSTSDYSDSDSDSSDFTSSTEDSYSDP